MVTVAVVDDGAGFEDALAVRRRVFVDGQGVDPDLEVDDHEDEATHFVAYEAANPSASRACASTTRVSTRGQRRGSTTSRSRR